MLMLSREGPLPLYYQLKTVILREIEAGHWQPDVQLPTENELARRFSVSKITVRQALRELAGEGFIRREQGRGTFVERRRLQQGPRELTSFTDEMRRHGLVPTSRVLKQEMVPAPPAVASALRIAPEVPVFRLRRLRLANREPLGVQTAYIPLDLAPGIAEISFADASLYDVLQSRYSLHPATARETYCVTLLKREVAALMRVPARSPAMTAERVTFLANGRPLEYVQSVMRGDRYKIAIDLTRYPTRSA
jgi:GntR family transcriptional regulator, N-acetylglucosamine utilization regulator